MQLDCSRYPLGDPVPGSNSVQGRLTLVIVDAVEDIGKVGLRIKTVYSLAVSNWMVTWRVREFCAWSACKEPVFSVLLQWAQGALAELCLFGYTRARQDRLKASRTAQDHTETL